MKNPERNREIIAFLEAHDWSYQLVADKFKITRNTVAGVVFRHRHPIETRVESPNAASPNKIGGGWRPRSYDPAFHAQNSVVR